MISWTVARQAPLSMGILQARILEWVAMPFPSPEHLPNPGIESTSSVLQADSLPTELQVKCQKNIYFCFIDCTKAFDYVDHSKLWKILQEMGIPGHLTCPLRSLYAVQEATVRTGYGTWTGFKLGKEYVKDVYCHPAYLTYLCKVHHEKCWAGRSTSWNQDCREKYQ